LDANGILSVSALDKGTGKSESITITNDKGRLSSDEIDRMVEEAEKYKEEDERLRAKVEIRNQFETQISSLKTQIEDAKGLGGKLSDEDKTALRDAISKGESWLMSNSDTASKEDIEEQKAEFEKVVTPITKKLYGDSGSGGSSGKAYDDEDDINHDEL
jgi:heat shock protein 5